jgi:hypothetical protein
MKAAARLRVELGARGRRPQRPEKHNHARKESHRFPPILVLSI